MVRREKQSFLRKDSHDIRAMRTGVHWPLHGVGVGIWSDLITLPHFGVMEHEMRCMFVEFLMKFLTVETYTCSLASYDEVIEFYLISAFISPPKKLYNFG